MQNEEKETLSSRILAQKSKHRWEAQAMKRHREIPPLLPLSRPLNPKLLTFSAQLHFLSHKHLVANSLLKHIRIQRCYVHKASYRTASHSENRKCRTLCAQLLRISRWQQRSLKSRTSLFWEADRSSTDGRALDIQPPSKISFIRVHSDSTNAYEIPTQCVLGTVSRPLTHIVSLFKITFSPIK